MKLSFKAMIGVLIVLNALSIMYKKIPTQQSTAPTQAAPTPNQIISPDWSVAATLTALGKPPIAVGDVKTYPDWSISPALLHNTIDIGARFNPNPELLAQLSGDLVIDTDFYTHTQSLYKNTPIWTLQINQSNEPSTWANYADSTLAIADKIGRRDKAMAYLKQSKHNLSHYGQIFRQKNPTITKLAVVQFANSTNLRGFSKNSLFHPTIEAMGFEHVDFGDGNLWGNKDLRLAELAHLDDNTCLIAIKPFSSMLIQELEQNALWQRLDFANKCFKVVPPIWAWGGVPSMVGFGQMLADNR